GRRWRRPPSSCRRRWGPARRARSPVRPGGGRRVRSRPCAPRGGRRGPSTPETPETWAGWNGPGRSSIHLPTSPQADDDGEGDDEEQQAERQGAGPIGVELEVDGEGEGAGSPGDVAGEGDRRPELPESPGPGEHRTDGDGRADGGKHDP